jgi:hypothetical protein
MIGKLMVIAKSGLLPYYFSQDNINIDEDLLSGFCTAIYSFSQELGKPLTDIGFLDQRMLVREYPHGQMEKLILVSLYDEYNIEEGIENKMNHIYEKHFENHLFRILSGQKLVDKNLDKDIEEILNDTKLKNHFNKNYNWIKQKLERLINNPEQSGVYGYLITSSTNEFIDYNLNNKIMTYRNVQYLEEEDKREVMEGVLKEYLSFWNIKKVPQGVKPTDDENPFGLDLTYYNNEGKKILGVIINTSINKKEEDKNEILMYLFGTSWTMRQCVLDIEEKLNLKID